jgi:hypothetical protein
VFPKSVPELDKAGGIYYSRRREIMQDRQKGLTATYNRFHDANNSDSDIKDLRRLQMEMDYIVAAAYGWNDLELGHGFHTNRQAVRFTVSDPARRSVLDRLLQINQQCHAVESAAVVNEKAKKPKKMKGNVPTLF